jgi:surfeit locus 1 family protein
VVGQQQQQKERHRKTNSDGERVDSAIRTTLVFHKIEQGGAKTRNNANEHQCNKNSHATLTSHCQSLNCAALIKQATIMADTPRNHQLQTSTAPANRRIWLAVVLLGMMGTIFVGLGNWQLDRADQRREVAAMIESGRQSAPTELTETVDPIALKPWQSAQATGQWMPQFSVLLDNRNLDGKPGFWLATPLKLSPSLAILVLRGWVARPIGQYNPFPVVTQATDRVTVAGELAMRVPQLYELAQNDVQTLRPVAVDQVAAEKTTIDLEKLLQLQNVSVDAMSEATGLKFLPVVLMQTNASDAEALKQQWPTPSIDADTNIGYAMQWFSFSVIAFGAMGVLLWRSRRRAKI